MNTRMFTTACELPMAAVLLKQFQGSHCAKCFCSIGNNEQSVTCDDCLEVSYCSLKCQRGDWKSLHSKECVILQSQKGKMSMTSTTRLCIRVILSNSEAMQKHSFNGTAFHDLETNYTEFRSSSAHNEFISNIIAIISTAGNNYLSGKIDNIALGGMICSVLCNSFSIIDEERVEPIGSGVYVGLAKHNHSCSSNSHIVFNGLEAVLRSASNVYTHSITISYVSRMLPTSERRKAIRGVHFINCCCEMCLNEDQDLIGLASRCPDPQCTGYVKGTVCITCGKHSLVSPEEVSQTTTDLIEKMEKFYVVNSTSAYGGTPDEFSKLCHLRAEYGKILAECNVAILQLDEQIAFCVSLLPDEALPKNFDELAVKGLEHYISRLHLGSPEVTRRLFIACKCLVRGPNKPDIQLIRRAYESSCCSHGEAHMISKFFSNLL